MRFLLLLQYCWKMATVKSVEDMLSSHVDESVVSALVGSLESQLASSTIQRPSQDENTTSATINHVNNTVVADNNVVRLLDGQKQGVITVSQAVSLLNANKSTNVSAQIGDANSSSTNATNTISTLPGALPASGYITQVTGPSQQFLPPGNIRSTNNPELKVISQASQNSTVSTINTRSKTAAAAAAAMPNGSPGILSAKSNQSSSMSAIYDLATVASQQPPIVTSNTCATTSPATTSQIQVTIANGKQIVTTEAKSSLEKTVIVTVPNSVVTTMVHPQNVIQVSSPMVVSKGHVVTTSQPVSVVSQMVTNPSILTSGVQIVNVNPRLTMQGLPGQKLASRVMLNSVRIAAAPQILTARTGVAGQRFPSQNNAQIKVQTFQQQRTIAPRNQFTTQKVIPVSTSKGAITLPNIRGAVLIKTENGQFQMLNLSGAAGGAIPGTAYRLQSLPPGTATVRTVTPQQIVTVPALKTNQASVTVPQTIVGTILQQGTPVSDANSRLTTVNTTKSSVIKAGVNGNLTPLNVQTSIANTQPSTPTQLSKTPANSAHENQMSPNTAKKKCKNFLSTLIRLADEQPQTVARSVRNLIQGIIDGSINAEEFTSKLQKELNSAPQPYLVPFLKKNLPYLRQSLLNNELSIEGVKPPPPTAPTLPYPCTQVGLKRPTLPPTTQVRLMTGPNASFSTQLLQQNQNLLNQRFPGLRPATGSIQGKSILVGKTIAAQSPATVTALQSKFQGKYNNLTSIKDPGKRSFSQLRDDDDINDVAAMGGVNLIEETQKILASNSELVGTQIRSCKDESFLFSSALQRRIHAIAKKHGLEEVSPEVVSLISHASQVRLKSWIEKLSIVSEHRLETPKNDPRYEIIQDVKGQIKFIEELDKLEKRRHEEQEREILLRAAKSRSKLEDPEQLKLKQKAKEMQKAELEELRQREANTTALLAIGPRKKAKWENPPLTNQTSSPFPGSSNSSSNFQARPRIKRVNIRDLVNLMEQERETVRKPLLYKSYLK